MSTLERYAETVIEASLDLLIQQLIDPAMEWKWNYPNLIHPSGSVEVYTGVAGVFSVPGTSLTPKQHRRLHSAVEVCMANILIRRLAGGAQ